ncbi:MAG: pantoate kinase [Nitrososphaera sp.]
MASTLVTAPVAVAKAFSPGHITGFFDIPPSTDDHFLNRGSRGAGFSVDRGITTSVQIYESARPSCQISLNGVRSLDADVSMWVLEKYSELADKPYFAKVDHEVGIPIGYGLGSSGAAALSLSYALNRALGLGLSKSRAAQIAHQADITCKTGLGTVIAEYVGGFEMRTGVGAPGVGEITTMDIHDHSAVVLCLSPISTKAFLTNRMGEINGLGGKMLEKLSVTRNVEDFLRMSREFAETIGLTKGICKAPIDALRAKGFDSSVAMFGETVFTLVPRTRAKEARDALRGFGGTVFTCGINSGGARVL